ncbi:MAG: universal stress protein [Rhodopirellula sp. JB055]|uniref:universal stress protein n=1 Tax=Rhodopirellula sp. JB055 TaxID=3342846 RepID=UPI00370C1463
MKKILLTVDGSIESLEAARFLAHLPFREPVELVVVTAIPEEHSQKTFLVDGWGQTWKTRKRHAADQAFEQVREIFHEAGLREPFLHQRSVHLTQVVREGVPGKTIVAIANEHQPDLLVVGSKRHSAVSRVLLGSTSDHVATHVGCSVLVVRANSRTSDHSLFQIAIGYEPSEASENAVNELADYGWASQSEVRVLTVTDKMDAQVPSQEPALEWLENVVERFRHVFANVQCKLIHCDHIGDGLVDYIDTHPVDLVVVGESPRSGFDRLDLGSTTRFVLRHSISSVWIARERAVHKHRELRGTSSLQRCGIP